MVAEMVHNSIQFLSQTRNQEFLRAGEIFENKGTLINISSAAYERKALQEKISEIFFLDTLKTAF